MNQNDRSDSAGSTPGTGPRLSLSTVAFPPDQLERTLEWAARLPVAGIELGQHHARSMAGSERSRKDALAGLAERGVQPLSVHAWTQVEFYHEKFG